MRNGGKLWRHRWLAGSAMPGAWLALGLVLAAAGCSEKPPAHALVWQLSRTLPIRRASLSGVVATSRDQAIAVGYDRPEGYESYLALSLVKRPAGWTYLQLPDPATGSSIQLYGTAGAADGTVWVCGRVADYEDEPSRLIPIIYRYLGGVWSEFPISGLGDLNGVQLQAIATSGTGSRLELRAVGTAAWGLAGAAIRYSGGQWNWDSPPAPMPGGANWSLAAVGRAPDGRWYAAGAPGGAVYVSDRVGWTALAGPAGFSSLRFTAIGFGADGVGWFAANYAVGDSSQGVLFRYQSGGFSPVAVARRSPGGYHINALAFDVEGHGWAVGGRAGNQPFLAGTSGAGWTESLAEIEREEAGPAGALGGGQLFGVSVVGAEVAIAVGYRTELDPKGLLESEASLYELVPRPIGEVDVTTPPLASRSARRGP